MTLLRGRLLLPIVLLAACLAAGLIGAREAEAGGAPITYVVDTTSDNLITQCDSNVAGDCSWRGAMQNASTYVGGVITIQFKISPGGVRTINVGSQVATLANREVVIDGMTQQDVSPLGCTVQQGGRPCIVLNGGGLNQDGIIAAGTSDVAVKGLAIVGFVSAIWLSSGVGHFISYNYLGTADGTTDNGNQWGVYVGSNAAVAGMHGNVISGNEIGIQADPGADLYINANKIGTNAAGTAALGNDHGGILLDNVEGARIGLANPEYRNVISGNGSPSYPFGIQVKGGNEIEIFGNYIGTNAAGTQAIGNLGTGIDIPVAISISKIGGPLLGAGNVISGNQGPGISMLEPEETEISYNHIGTNAVGNAAVPNGGDGILINEGPLFNDGNLVTNNVISANSGRGIRLNTGVNGISFARNKIGTNAAGSVSFPNLLGGVYIDGLAYDNYFQLTTISSPSNQPAIWLNGTERHFFTGNFIGISEGGAALSGGSVGILVSSDDAPVYIGNSDFAEDPAAGPLPEGPDPSGNWIRNTASDGIRVTGATSRARITGNSIYGSGGLGINLENGANKNIAAPVLTSAQSGSTVVTGSFTGMPSLQYRIEFFASPACDTGGAGEGRDYVGSKLVNTNGSGVAMINATLPPTVPDGVAITATAAPAEQAVNGAITSEFSNCVIMGGGSSTPTPTPTPTPNGSITPTPTSVGSQTPTPTPSGSVTPTPTSSGTPILGDADCDGDVDMDDAIAALSHAADVDPAPCEESADTDCDDDVDAMDALRIAAYVSGVPMEPANGCGQVGT